MNKQSQRQEQIIREGGRRSIWFDQFIAVNHGFIVSSALATHRKKQRRTSSSDCFSPVASVL
jgi:hypothetical protein